MKALIIDDEKDYGLKICKTLAENGFITFFATDLKDGFRIADREKIDFILTDLNMPFDGFRVVEAIRDKDKTIPIMLYTRTNSMSKELREIADEIGVTLFQSGATIESLLDAVKNKLSNAVEENSKATKNFLNSI